MDHDIQSGSSTSETQPTVFQNLFIKTADMTVSAALWGMCSFCGGFFYWLVVIF